MRMRDKGWLTAVPTAIGTEGKDVDGTEMSGNATKLLAKDRVIELNLELIRGHR
jgi:hypothetical protein